LRFLHGVWGNRCVRVITRIFTCNIKELKRIIDALTDKGSNEPGWPVV
jgi:hypothetical protein